MTLKHAHSKTHTDANTQAHSAVLLQSPELLLWMSYSCREILIHGIECIWYIRAFHKIMLCCFSWHIRYLPLKMKTHILQNLYQDNWYSFFSFKLKAFQFILCVFCMYGFSNNSLKTCMYFYKTLLHLVARRGTVPVSLSLLPMDICSFAFVPQKVKWRCT